MNDIIDSLHMILAILVLILLVLSTLAAIVVAGIVILVTKGNSRAKLIEASVAPLRPYPSDTNQSRTGGT